MLGQIVLIAIQFAFAFFAGPEVAKHVPAPGDLKIFVLAVAYAVIVWIVALVGSFALKDVNLPSTRTLAAALAGAVIGAILTLIPGFMSMIPIKFPPSYLPLIGAIVGYVIRRS